MNEEFKVGDRVEWCFGGKFSEYETSTDLFKHDFATVVAVKRSGILADFERSNTRGFHEPFTFRKVPDEQPKPPFRWLVTYFEAENEFAGDHSTNVYESAPVLQYWNGAEYVDVPVEKVRR